MGSPFEIVVLVLLILVIMFLAIIIYELQDLINIGMRVEKDGCS